MREIFTRHADAGKVVIPAQAGISCIRLMRLRHETEGFRRGDGKGARNRVMWGTEKEGKQR